MALARGKCAPLGGSRPSIRAPEVPTPRLRTAVRLATVPPREAVLEEMAIGDAEVVVVIPPTARPPSPDTLVSVLLALRAVVPLAAHAAVLSEGVPIAASPRTVAVVALRTPGARGLPPPLRPTPRTATETPPRPPAPPTTTLVAPSQTTH